MNILLIVGSLNLTDIVLAQKKLWFIIPFFPLFLLFFISLLAETNRIPFDLPEAEGELVSGYNVEYSAIGFALSFLAEYANIILMSHLIVIIFFGGWSCPINNDFLNFFIMETKVNLFLFIFIWIRATFPRYRYDQLMTIGWKFFLPLAISWIIFYSSFFFAFNFLF
jgi:NADH-quinone oxidoreductase subunit H